MNARVDAIRKCLEQTFTPLMLSVEDESHRHAGHAGARDGRGHFRIFIVSTVFSKQSLMTRHKAVYAALGELMQTDIHALAINARAPEET